MKTNKEIKLKFKNFENIEDYIKNLREDFSNVGFKVLDIKYEIFEYETDLKKHIYRGMYENYPTGWGINFFVKIDEKQFKEIYQELEELELLDFNEETEKIKKFQHFHFAEKIDSFRFKYGFYFYYMKKGMPEPYKDCIDFIVPFGRNNWENENDWHIDRSEE